MSLVCKRYLCGFRREADQQPHTVGVRLQIEIIVGITGLRTQCRDGGQIRRERDLAYHTSSHAIQQKPSDIRHLLSVCEIRDTARGAALRPATFIEAIA